jgi:hypothetical protein
MHNDIGGSYEGEWTLIDDCTIRTNPGAKKQCEYSEDISGVVDPIPIGTLSPSKREQVEKKAKGDEKKNIVVKILKAAEDKSGLNVLVSTRAPAQYTFRPV